MITIVINKLLTTVNFKKGSNKQNKYIVIHYVGAEGGAKDNCRYFEKFYRGASAHYFVGHEGEVWQCVEDKDIAWHCGATKYKHPECRNDNSIGVEMCCRKRAGNWYFEDKTVSSTVALVKELMKKYNIPIENVIRHYDVMGKICPAPYVYNNTNHTWDAFKKLLKEEKPMAKDNTPDNYAKEAIEWATANKILNGNGQGDLMLHKDITRQDLMVVLHNFYKKFVK